MEKEVYHGSPNGDIKALEGRKSIHGEKCIYATDNKVIAMFYMGKGLGDLDYFLDVDKETGIPFYVERREGVLEKTYNKSGYIYTLPGESFNHYNGIWDGEVISFEEKIVPIKIEFYENVLEEIKKEAEKGNVKLYQYPSRPNDIPLDNSDLIEKYVYDYYYKRGLTGSIDSLLDNYPEFKERVEQRLKELYPKKEDKTDQKGSKIFMTTPYQNIAKEALINWNGLTEEEAILKIQTESVNELESQVYAMDSVKSAVFGLSKQIDLTQNETIQFLNAVFNGPASSEIFKIVAEKAQGLTDEQKLNILSTIHDGWVISNSNEKTINKKIERQQLRQYAPLELIGWNEVKSDLLFLKPILASINIETNEQQLEKTYYQRVSEYLEEMQINNLDDLSQLVEQGTNYYLAISDELNNRLQPLSDVVAKQIIENWNNKNPQIIEMFNQRQLNQSSLKNLR